MRNLVFILLFTMPLAAMSQSETVTVEESLTEGAAILINNEPGLEGYVLQPNARRHLDEFTSLDHVQSNNDANIIFARNNGEEVEGQEYRYVNLGATSDQSRDRFSNPTCGEVFGAQVCGIKKVGGLNVKAEFGGDSDSSGNR